MNKSIPFAMVAFGIVLVLAGYSAANAGTAQQNSLPSTLSGTVTNAKWAGGGS
jgi:hypothetical protein